MNSESRQVRRLPFLYFYSSVYQEIRARRNSDDEITGRRQARRLSAETAEL